MGKADPMTTQDDRQRADGYIPASEAAEMAGRPITTIYRWAEQNKVKYRKVASAWYVEEASLREHLGPDAILAEPKAVEGE